MIFWVAKIVIKINCIILPLFVWHGNSFRWSVIPFQTSMFHLLTKHLMISPMVLHLMTFFWGLQPHHGHIGLISKVPVNKIKYKTLFHFLNVSTEQVKYMHCYELISTEKCNKSYTYYYYKCIGGYPRVYGIYLYHYFRTCALCIYQ